MINDMDNISKQVLRVYRDSEIDELLKREFGLCPEAVCDIYQKVVQAYNELFFEHAYNADRNMYYKITRNLCMQVVKMIVGCETERTIPAMELFKKASEDLNEIIKSGMENFDEFERRFEYNMNLEIALKYIIDGRQKYYYSEKETESILKKVGDVLVDSFEMVNKSQVLSYKSDFLGYERMEVMICGLNIALPKGIKGIYSYSICLYNELPNGELDICGHKGLLKLEQGTWLRKTHLESVKKENEGCVYKGMKEPAEMTQKRIMFVTDVILKTIIQQQEQECKS